MDEIKNICINKGSTELAKELILAWEKTLEYLKEKERTRCTFVQPLVGESQEIKPQKNDKMYQLRQEVWSETHQ